jgi:hypothetical protein
MANFHPNTAITVSGVVVGVGFGATLPISPSIDDRRLGATKQSSPGPRPEYRKPVSSRYIDDPCRKLSSRSQKIPWYRAAARPPVTFAVKKRVHRITCLRREDEERSEAKTPQLTLSCDGNDEFVAALGVHRSRGVSRASQPLNC